MGNCTFDAHDIGGHVAAREDWVNHYYGPPSTHPSSSRLRFLFICHLYPHIRPPNRPIACTAGVNAVIFIVDSADR